MGQTTRSVFGQQLDRGIAQIAPPLFDIRLSSHPSQGSLASQQIGVDRAQIRGIGVAFADAPVDGRMTRGHKKCRSAMKVAEIVAI